MPGLGLNFFRVLFRSDGAVPKTNILRGKQRLLNIPILSYGEEYVKRYANRFGTC